MTGKAGADGRVSGPRDAEITIIGGGAVGAAVAYFLARDGRTRHPAAGGPRACARRPVARPPGSSGQARPTVERARLTMAATEVYRSFERDTGYPMDYRECGAVRLALSEASVRELRQIAETAEVTGLPVEFLTDAQLHEVYSGAGAYRLGQGGAVVADRRLPAAEQPRERVRAARPGTSASRWRRTRR